MAGFKTHITTSTIFGVGYGAAAYAWFDVPWPTCVLAGGLCGVAGMLPDLDSGSGRPIRESMALAGAVVAMMTMGRFELLGLPAEMVILAGTAVYLLVRFGIGALLRRYTVHRGMFHSLPAAVIAGEIAFLLASGDDVRLRAYKAGGVVLGFLSHLVLDEIYSLEMRHGMPRFKKSFGSALKLLSEHWWPNISTYAKLLILTLLVLKEPGWTNELRQHRQQQPAATPTQPASNTPGMVERAKERIGGLASWWE